jgi:hypothetical protein
MEPKYNNFIATPIGDIYFSSGMLKGIDIKEVNSEINYLNVEFLDIKQFEKFINPYVWDHICVMETDNGLFMKIELDGEYYGLPVFKIYTVY